MSLNVGLFTGLSAIRAGQAGINTVSHNISNVSTPGYTRQRVDLVAAEPYSSPDGMLGTGVDVDGIRRLRDHFLDARVRTTGADFANQDVRSQLLSRTEAVMGEPDDGITSELNKLWNAFEDLSIEPESIATRRQVLNQLDAVASRINGVATAWDQLAADTTSRRDASIDEVNGLLEQVADINRRVAKADEGKISNDLLDQRDLAIDRIAELTGATAKAGVDGMVNVSLGNEALVAETVFTPLDVETMTVKGEIGALHVFVSGDGTDTLPGLRDKLDLMAVELIDLVNAAHAGPGGTSPPGDPLLQGTDAASIARNPQVGPDELVAGNTTGELDGERAATLAALRSSPVVDSVEDLVIDLGAATAGAARSARAAGDVAVAAETSRQSQHGVSIDEEMVDLVRFQRQLEAASRVMTAVDQALDTLVNRVGIVGR